MCFLAVLFLSRNYMNHLILFMAHKDIHVTSHCYNNFRCGSQIDIMKGVHAVNVVMNHNWKQLNIIVILLVLCSVYGRRLLFRNCIYGLRHVTHVDNVRRNKSLKIYKCDGTYVPSKLKNISINLSSIDILGVTWLRISNQLRRGATIIGWYR